MPLLRRGGGFDKKQCRGEAKIALKQCQNCGYVFNAEFKLEQIKKEYSSGSYLSRKIVSKAMNENIKQIKNKILKHLSKDSNCLEIAPGSGDMVLALIDEVRSFTTIDPSLVSLSIENKKNLRHIQGFFSYELLKDKLEHKPDFIMFRHLLEHIDKPLNFLKDLGKILANDGLIYVEVPNLDEFAEHKRFYELVNDHCGYYQKNVLINALEHLEYEFIDELSLYRKQHIGLFFRKNGFKAKEKHEVRLYDLNFQKDFSKAIKNFNSHLENYENIAIYGAGGHGNSLLNYIDSEKLFKLKKCFDLDERKQGKFLQNSNIKIVKPEFKEFENLDLILMATPLYEQEALNLLKENGFKGDILLTEKEFKLV